MTYQNQRNYEPNKKDEDKTYLNQEKVKKDEVDDLLSGIDDLLKEDKNIADEYQQQGGQ